MIPCRDEIEKRLIDVYLSKKRELAEHLSQIIYVLHNVQKWGKIGILLIFTVNSVVHRDKADTLLRKENFRIKAHSQIVTAQPRHIFDNDNGHIPGLNFRQHFLETRTLKVCPRKSIVHEKTDIGKTMFLCVLGEQFLLRANM